MLHRKQKLGLAVALSLAVVVKGAFALCKAHVEQGEQVENMLTVEQFADWAGLPPFMVAEKLELEPWLFDRESVESVEGFNPYTCEGVRGGCGFKTLEQLENSFLTDDQAWKWFRYRREEIGACFEDENFNENTQKCELIEDLR